jgi:putative flippase GtrA
MPDTGPEGSRRDALAPAHSGLRHWVGFLASGGLAFGVDVALSTLFAQGFGWPWAVSRLVAIAAAMVVAWLAHRRLTFALTTPATLQEFVRYAGLGWSAAALNYGVFLCLIWLLPWLEPAIAIAIASVVAMVASYLGMRFAVFQRSET